MAKAQSARFSGERNAPLEGTRVSDDDDRVRFLHEFGRHRRTVLLARSLRVGLAGLGAGLLVAVAASSVSVLWFGGEGRLWSLTLAPLGLLVGIATGWRRRWSDDEVALFLDARLATQGSVGAALSPGRETQLLSSVYRAANARLSTKARVRPPIFAPVHSGVALLGVLLIPLMLIEPRKIPAPPRSTGTEPLTKNELEGLSPLKGLDQLEALDAEQEQKLAKLSQRALELERRLADGMEQREAQASIAKLRDELDALAGELSNAENRAGLAAAVEALRRDPKTEQAASALGDGDLVRFDDEMRKLAQAAEQEARNTAKEGLEEAQRLAEQRGARALSSALSEQRNLFDERERSAKLLRELASSMPGNMQQKLEGALGSELSEKTQKQLADALEKALESLSDDELERLGQRIKQAIEDGSLDLNEKDAADLQRLAEQFEKGEGKEELREMLKQLGQPGKGSRTMQGLRGAQEGLRRAQRELTGVLPVPRASPQAGSNQGQRAPHAQEGKNGAPGRGPGAGEHRGQTDELEGNELRALAQPKLDLKSPLLHASQGRTGARPGEAATVPDLNALSAVRADEVQGVEHSSIPEEYREQVSKYFAPE